MRRKWRHKKKRNFRIGRSFSPDDITRHHRKPRRLGGENSGINISYVRRDEHAAWHILFDSLDAQGVIIKFKEYWMRFGRRISINGEIFGKITKKKRAWQTLFGNKPIHRIISEINDIWLDPEFKIRARIPNLKESTLIENRARSINYIYA